MIDLENCRQIALAKRVFRLAWVGPDSGECANVLRDFERCCRQLDIETDISIAPQLVLEDVGDRDRVILSSVTRAEYPREAIHFLTTGSHIVPWGVVTDSWHLGSRRSGEGAVSHWQQPWFRWWDSWFGWFFPEWARPESVVPAAYGPIVTALDYAQPGEPYSRPVATDCQLAILCSCRKTAELYERQALHVGWVPRLYRSLTEFVADSQSTPELLVWDDSLLSVLPAMTDVDSAQSAIEQIGQLSRIVPAQRIIAALDLEHLHLWHACQASGIVELIVKPSYALALSNYLHYYPIVARFSKPSERSV